MSGHSKWATIKRQKEVADKQRGKIFSKLTRAITIAAHEGGASTEMNFKLRLAIEKAKQANMPKENIERAIKKGTGEIAGERWEEVTFEGYGPEGVGVIVETLTDNRNRTTAEIKNIFERGGGSLASPGAVSFQFKKKGLIIVEKAQNKDEQVLRIIDLGVVDVEEVDDVIEVYTLPERLGEMRQKIEKEGFRVKEAELMMQPTSPLVIEDSQKAQKILGFMENLEESEDVQKIWANFDVEKN